MLSFGMKPSSVVTFNHILGQHSAFFFRVYVNQDEKVAVCMDVLVQISKMGTMEVV
jgi:hypothetical protein